MMPRRKWLFVQMYTTRRKAKLERQRAEERARKEWAVEGRKMAAQAAKEAAQQRRKEELAAQVRL